MATGLNLVSQCPPRPALQNKHQQVCCPSLRLFLQLEQAENEMEREIKPVSGEGKKGQGSLEKDTGELEV